MLGQSVLDPLWTTAPVYLVEIIGLTGVGFSCAAGSFSPAQPTCSNLYTSDQSVSYTVPFSALFSCVCFRGCSCLFLGLSCVGVAPPWLLHAVPRTLGLGVHLGLSQSFSLQEF